MKSWKKKFLAFIAAVAAAVGISIGVPTSPVPEPTPSATPSPITEPTAVPTALPTPTAEPTSTPVPTPTPIPQFPVRLPLAGVKVYMNNHQYGMGVDSTVRIRGDRELCEALHHVPVPSGDCHFDSNVWLYKGQRAEYEMAVLGGCPVWQFRATSGVHRCHDDQNAQHSCDHFGNVEFRDDPKTTVFEGQPAACGKQVDNFGPYAGFFIIAHKGEGDMEVRSCPPHNEGDDSTCGPWKLVTWR